MSEYAPQPSRFDEALNNFDANKAKYEENQWLDKIHGESRATDGITDFSDDARNHLQELQDYRAHMERLSQRERIDPDDKQIVKDGQIMPFMDTQVHKELMDLNDQPSPAFEREVEDAHAEDEAFDARKEAERAALEEKFKTEPRLRQMDLISREIETLSEKHVDVETESQVSARIKELEDRLEELLNRYEASDDYDLAIADLLMDPSSKEAHLAAAKNALKSEEERKKASERVREALDPTDADTNSESSEADNAESSSSDEATKSESEESDFDETIDPTELEKLRGVEPISLEDEGETVKDTPEVVDDKTDEVDETIDPAELETLRDAKPIDLSDDESELPKAGWRARAFVRLSSIFTKGRDWLAGSGDRKRGTRRTMAVAIGAVAAVGVAIVLKDTSGFSLFGGGHGVDHNALPPSGGDSAASMPEYTSSVSHVEAVTDTINVPSGGGWDAAMQQMGIQSGKMNDILTKVGPDLVKRGIAYKMNNGSYGISRPGILPQDVIELIQNNQ